VRPNVAAIALTFALATNGWATAQSPTCQPHLVGADRRGPARAIARSGGMVYLGAGAAVVVIDAADPQHPIERGYVNLDGVVRDVASWGWTAIALIPDALEFVNADDPEHPHVVGSFPLDAAWDVQTIDARDAMVFFTAPDGLHIVSFADRTAPEEIGTFAIAGVADVAARNGRAYLLADSALHVLDTSDPASPVEIAQVPVPDWADRKLVVAPSGSRLVTWGGHTDGRHNWGAVGFFDLADPDLPVLRSSLYYDDPGFPRSVALGGGRAYVNVSGFVVIFDLSNLAHPQQLGTFDATHAGQILVATPPEYLLAADPWRGFKVFDVASPQNVHEAAYVGTPRPTSDGYFLGSLAVTMTENALRTFDLGDPTRPNPIGELEVEIPDYESPGLDRILRVGTRAFANSDFGVRTFDLSDPAQPRGVEPLTTVYDRLPPALDRGLLFAQIFADHAVGIWDVSDPATPLLVGEVGISNQSFAYDFTAARGVLYLSEGGYLHVFDVHDPAHPVELASLPMFPLHQGRSVVAGRHLFLADQRNLRVLDISAPQQPSLVADLLLPDANPYNRRVHLYGSQLLIAPDVYERWPPSTFDDRLLVFDVSDPVHPVQDLALDTPGDARGAFAGPGLIVVADGEAGISVYDSCVPFADGFESGDTSEWSAVQP
jgi:hypothetical protein